MRRLGWLGLISALAISAAPPAQAQGKVDPADLECLTLGLMMVGAKDQNAQSTGLMTSLYYLGKIDSKAPGIDLEQPIFELAQKINPQVADPIAKRCGAELQARGKSMTEMGERIEKRAAAAGLPKAQ